MSYRRDVISKADAILAERRSKSEIEMEAHIAEAREKVPEFDALYRELTFAMVDILSALRAESTADTKAIMQKAAEKNLAVQAGMAKALKDAGYPEDYASRHCVCEKCGDTGYVNEKVCECRKALIQELSLNKLSENSPSEDCTFDSFSLDFYPTEPDERYGIAPRTRMKQILSFCRAYADDFDIESESLYFYGATGLGKTHLALAIAKAVTLKGYNVIYDSASGILRRIEKEHFASARDDRYDGSLDEFINCDLLIIDDLGSEFSTSFTVSKVYELLDSRLCRGKPVIISSNLNTKALEERYTERIASRIFGTYRTLLFLGSDVRQLKK